MNPKIFLFTTDTIQRGGKERQLFIIARHLIDHGYNIQILTLKLSDENYIDEYHIPRDVISLIGAGYSLNNYLKYKEIVGSFNADLVISWDVQTSIYNFLLYRRKKFIFINASIQHGIRLLRLSQLLRSVVCWLSPFVIANSIAGLKANNLQPGKRRFVLHNGIETKFRNNLPPKEKEDLKKSLIPGYSNNPGFVYITVANFVPYKDYFTIFRSLSKLKERQYFYYFIVGDGPMRSSIEEHIIDFNLQENVIMVGRTENVNEYFFASDVMIHSSRGEGISNAILEAMHAGLPVIATNVGGVPETVYTGSSLLFPYKGYETLYRCLLKSQELKESLNPESEEYQAHLRKFSVETMVRRFEEIIDIVTRNKN